MKLVLRLLIILFMLILIAAAFLLSETGLRLSVDLASKVIPGEIKYKSISGVIIGPITINNLTYQNDGQTIKIKTLDFNWQPIDLIKKELTISHLDINDLSVTSTHTTAQPKEKISNKTIKEKIHALQNMTLPTLPIKVNINKIAAKNLSYIDKKNHINLHIDTINFSQDNQNHTVNAALNITLLKNYPINMIQFTLQNKRINLMVKGSNTNLSANGIASSNNFKIHTEDTKLLNGTLNASFSLNNKKPYNWTGSLNAQKLDISSLLSNWTKALSASIKTHGNIFNSNTKIKLQIPDGFLHTDIHYEDTLKIDWQLKIHNLSLLNQDYSGTLLSEGAIHAKSPSILITHGHVTANRLSTPDFYAKKTVISWKLNSNHDHHIHATLNAHDVELLQQRINTIHFKSTGTIDNQTLTGSIAQGKNRYELNVKGSYKNDEWHGTITKLEMHTSKKVIWKLEKPTNIVIANNVSTFSTLCLIENNTNKLCAEGSFSAISPWEIKVSANLPFTILKHFIPQRFAKVSNGLISVNLKISRNDTRYPILKGNIDVSNGHIFLPEQNITLDNFNIKVTGKNDLIQYTISASSNNSPITLAGSTNFSKTPLTTSIKLTTNNTLLYNTEEYIIYITSQLKAHITGKKVTLTGDITIPNANIQPHDFHTVTTLPTNDVIIVGKKETNPNPWEIDSILNINLGDDVNVQTSGIKAKLAGKLKLVSQTNKETFATGQIRVLKGSYSAFGKTLVINKDSFINYSNSFLDNPFLNIKATKKIASVRGTGEEFVVGISLSGTIKNPDVTFFSSPATLSQADILSYLILGYANNTNAPGDHDILLQALSALDITSQGLAGKQNISAQIQQGLGLSELGVESENTVDALGTTLNRQSSFVIGKRLTNDFIVRYSIGILDPVDVFQLRYLLNQNWALQGDSSAKGYGFDALYSIERD